MAVPRLLVMPSSSRGSKNRIEEAHASCFQGVTNGHLHTTSTYRSANRALLGSGWRNPVWAHCSLPNSLGARFDETLGTRDGTADHTTSLRLEDLYRLTPETVPTPTDRVSYTTRVVWSDEGCGEEMQGYPNTKTHTNTVAFVYNLEQQFNLIYIYIQC